MSSDNYKMFVIASKSGSRLFSPKGVEVTAITSISIKQDVADREQGHKISYPVRIVVECIGTIVQSIEEMNEIIAKRDEQVATNGIR